VYFSTIFITFWWDKSILL